MRFFNFHKKQGKQRGFTVIEAVVSAGVFAFVLSSILGVYLATIQLDAKTRAERAVQQNARFIMEFLGKEVRNGSINFASTNDSDTLSLINQLDEQEQIFWDGTENLMLTKAGMGTTKLNSDGVRITRVLFLTAPDDDPFVMANDEHIQPHVVVVLRIESNYGDRPTDMAAMDLQTTFTTRNYPSRL